MNRLSTMPVSASSLTHAILKTYVRTVASATTSKSTTKKTTRKKSTETKEKPVKKSKKATSTPQLATIPQDIAEFKKYNSDYKCAEYYAYADTSFYDIENAMANDRCSQPSAL